MQYGTIKQIAEKSAKLVLGGDSFGASIPEDASFALMDAYHDAGGNHIDTAHLYGIGSVGGEQICEKVIGKWMKERNNRNRVLISTKGAHPPLSDMHHSRVRKAEIKRDLEESLFALDTDYIDLYWLHRDDPAIPAGEIVEWMNELQNEGNIRAFGASNWTAKRLEEANTYAEAHGLSPFSAGQILFSAAQAVDAHIPDDTLVWMNEEEMAYYRKKLLPVFCYSAQGKGYFSKLAAGEKLCGMAKDWFDSEENRRRLPILVRIAQRRSISVTAVALAFLWSGGVDAYPIIGCKTVTQLKDSLLARDVILTTEEYEAIEKGAWK